MSLLDSIFFFILLLIGFNIKSLYPNFNRYERKILNYLFVFHILMSFVFFYTINESGGYAIKYWYDIKTLSFSELKVLIQEDFDPTIFPILGIGVIGNLFTIIYEQKQGLYASIASVVITLCVNLVVGASKNMLFVGLGYFLCNFLSFFVFYFWIKIIITNQLKFKNDY